jgi:hypothetical protein
VSAAGGVRRYAVQFVVTAWPVDHDDCHDAGVFCLTVTSRGGGRWPVGQSRGHSSPEIVLTRDGKWEADQRGDPRFRFGSYAEALTAARRHAATMTVGGHVAADVIARHLAGHCPDRNQTGGAR